MTKEYQKGYQDCQQNMCWNKNPHHADTEPVQWKDYNNGFNECYIKLSNDLLHADWVARRERNWKAMEKEHEAQLYFK